MCLHIGAPSGAQCDNPAQVYCTSHEWSAANYLNYQYDEHDIWTWRSEYLSDATGQRTGFKGNFAEFDLGYGHWVGDAAGATCTGSSGGHTYTFGNTGGSAKQAMLAMDAILHF